MRSNLFISSAPASFPQPPFPILKGTRKLALRLMEQRFQSLCGNALRAKGDGGLLFQHVIRGDGDFVFAPVFRDKPLDHVIRGLPGAGIKNLDAARFRFLRHLPSLPVEYHGNMDACEILVLGQLFDERLARNNVAPHMHLPHLRPCEDDAVAVHDEDSYAHLRKLQGVRGSGHAVQDLYAAAGAAADFLAGAFAFGLAFASSFTFLRTR